MWNCQLHELGRNAANFGPAPPQIMRPRPHANIQSVPWRVFGTEKQEELGALLNHDDGRFNPTRTAAVTMDIITHRTPMALS